MSALLIFGASWYAPSIYADDEEEEVGYLEPMDTAAMIGGKAFGFATESKSDVTCIVYGKDILLDDPFAKLDWSKKQCTVDLMGGRRQVFVHTDQKIVEKIKAFDVPLDGFARIKKKYENKGREDWYGTFYLTLEYPTDNPGVWRWLCHLIDRYRDLTEHSELVHTLYRNYVPKASSAADDKIIPNFAEAEARYAANRYFSEYCSEEIGLRTSYSSLDLRVRIANERFVTYSGFGINNMGYLHPLFTVNLLSYDIANDCPINNDYLFKKGSMKAVKHLLYSMAAKDPVLLEWYPNGLDAEGVEYHYNDWCNRMLNDQKDAPEFPDGALTDEGVAFTFQYYQIAGFVAGTFHYVIPYDKLRPYLTPQALKLLRLIGR